MGAAAVPRIRNDFETAAAPILMQAPRGIQGTADIMTTIGKRKRGQALFEKWVGILRDSRPI